MNDHAKERAYGKIRVNLAKRAFADALLNVLRNFAVPFGDLITKKHIGEFVTFEMMPKWLFNYQTTRRFLRENAIDVFPEVWRPLSTRPLSF